jgi:hypothetical protein
MTTQTPSDMEKPALATITDCDKFGGCSHHDGFTMTRFHRPSRKFATALQ